MNKTIMKTLASIPAANSLFAFPSSASASALVGQFQFSSGFSNVNFSATSLIFGDRRDGENQVIITPGSQTGIFSKFKAAFIRNIELVPDTKPENNPFLDLEENLSILPGCRGDGFNVFNLIHVGDFNLYQNDDNVAIIIGLFGTFVAETGEKSDGAGSLSFQINNTTVDEVRTNLANGYTYENIGFSGGSFAVKFAPNLGIGNR